MKEKRKQIKRETNVDKISLYMILIIVSILPLLIRITQINYPTNNIDWLSEGQLFFDVFSYFKANVLIILGLSCTIIIGYKIAHERKEFFKSKIIIVSIIGMLITILSVIFSEYKYTSLFGFLERFEGALVLLCYFIFFIFSYKFIWYEGALQKFYKFFFIGNLILSVIGIFQYFGLDPLTSDFIKPFITSFSLDSSSMQTESSVNYRVITQTLYHYNYVAFFASLSLPIFLTRSLYEKHFKVKAASIILSILILFNLFGSSARGGMVGIAVGMALWVILNWRIIFKNKKLSLAFIVIMILTFVGFEAISGGFITNRFASMFNSVAEQHSIKRVYTLDNNVIIDLNDGSFRIETQCDPEGKWSISAYVDEKPISAALFTNGTYVFEDARLSLISYYFDNYAEEKDRLVVVTDKVKWAFRLDDNTLYLWNIYGYDKLLTYTASFGFEGREKLGSARGYIWSRTIPLIFEKPLLGYGPDTFPLIFPQEDYIGKYYAYGTDNMIVDKAHNVYLQTAINSGVLSLLIYVILLASFIFSGIKKIIRDKFIIDNYMISALLVSIVSYAVSAIFNDSSVHVAPVYWIMLGMGLSLVHRNDETTK